MNRHLYKLITLALFFFACNTEKSDKYVVVGEKDFEFQKQLQGEEIFKNEFTTSKISVLGSVLLLKQTKKDTCFKVYNTDLKYISGFGSIGDAPEQFLAPRFDGQKDISSKTETKLWINNRFKSKLFLVNLDSVIINNKISIEKEIKFNPSLNFTQNLLVMNDGIFIGNRSVDAIKPYWFRIYNSNDKKIVDNNLIPNLENTDLLNQSNWYMLLHTSLKAKPDNSKFVSAMSNFDRVGIFDKEGNLLKEIVGKDYGVFDVKEHLKNGSLDLKMYYQGLFASNKYIYVLYYNQLSSEYSNSIPTEIRVFNWDGIPIYNLKIPDYLMNFSVDEVNGFIYGVDHFNEKILRYNIKSILNEK